VDPAQNQPVSQSIPLQDMESGSNAKIHAVCLRKGVVTLEESFIIYVFDRNSMNPLNAFLYGHPDFQDTYIDAQIIDDGPTEGRIYIIAQGNGNSVINGNVGKTHFYFLDKYNTQFAIISNKVIVQPAYASAYLTKVKFAS